MLLGASNEANKHKINGFNKHKINGFQNQPSGGKKCQCIHMYQAIEDNLFTE